MAAEPFKLASLKIYY